MVAQGFAIGEAEQGSAIGDFARQAGGRAVILGLGEEVERVAEGAAVFFAIEAEEAGSSIIDVVAVVGRSGGEPRGRRKRLPHQPVGGVRLTRGMLAGYQAYDSDKGNSRPHPPMLLM